MAKRGRPKTHTDCSFAGCDRLHHSIGLCEGHYNQQYEGRSLRTLRAYVKSNGQCSVAECPKPHLAHGFCDMHLKRFEKHGDPLKSETDRIPQNASLEERKAHAIRKRTKRKVWQQAYEQKFEVKAKHRKWEHEHRAKTNTQSLRYQRRKRASVGDYTETQWQDRLAFYGFRCYLCGYDWWSLPEYDRTIDHVIPISKGGSNWPANLRPACRKCNSKKHARDYFSQA